MRNLGPRTIAAITGIIALVALVVVGTPAGGTISTADVDYGVVGPTGVADWIGESITPTTMVSTSSTLPIFLGFRTDRAALEARAIAVSDPTSSSYGDHRSVSETAGIHNAGDAQITAVSDWFAARAVTIDVDPTRTFAFAMVPISVLEEMSGTTIGAFTAVGLPQDVVILTPNSTVSTIAAALEGSIDRVAGVTSFWDTTANSPAEFAEPEPTVDRLQPAIAPTLVTADGGTPWRTGTPSDACPEASSVTQVGVPAGISPGQLRTAYGIDALWAKGHRGAGARIAVTDANTYLPSDISAWRECFGLEGTEVTDHLIGAPTFSASGSAETTLDLQTIISIAPDAERIDWFGVESTASTLVGTYLQMLAPTFDADLTGGVAPDVVTLSFGNCESAILESDAGARPGLSMFEQMMATGAASGIGTFVATGDTGSTGCFPNDGTPSTDYRISPQFPSTSAWVTAVGGLNLTLDAANEVASSGAWNDRRLIEDVLARSTPLGSGTGGLSEMVPRSPWQPRVGAGIHRPVPDISAFADTLPGYFLHFDGQWTNVGGTSAATPLTAAAFALQSSARVARGGTRLGFVAPLLHSLSGGGDAFAASSIVDVTLGDNDVHDVGVYPAVDGYDMASGLGWIRHEILAEVLEPPAPDPIVPAFTG